MSQRSDAAERREQEPERWHLSKGIQIGHIVSSVVVIGAALMYITDMRRDMMVRDAELSARLSAVEQQQIYDRARASTERGEIIQKFNTIDTKLDLLMQRGISRR